MLRKFNEFKEVDVKPVIKSFIPKDELNPKIWDDFVIKEELRETLLEIAEYFYKEVDVEAEVKDIILTGSLANYNYSERYSDYDLHVVIDYTDVDDNVDLVRKYLSTFKSRWNENHDLKLKGYDVELYIQDEHEPHTSTGVYSLLKNKWLVKPSKEDVVIDERLIEEKALVLIEKVDAIELEFNTGNYDYDIFKEKLDKVWNKIKEYRKSGLESEGGEFSTGNLVFKLLRRNGYIAKVMDLKKRSYDQKFEKWFWNKSEKDDIYVAIRDAIRGVTVMGVTPSTSKHENTYYITTIPYWSIKIHKVDEGFKIESNYKSEIKPVVNVKTIEELVDFLHNFNWNNNSNKTNKYLYPY
jgi:hypothetical protein